MRIQLFQTLKQIWKSKDVRDKIFFSLAILAIFRILSSVPVVGISAAQIKSFFSSFAGNSFGEILAASGSILESASVVAIGLTPYINASIMLQLLGSVIPKLGELRKEGSAGRRKLSMITRIITVPLAFLQVFLLYSTLKGYGLIGEINGLQFLTMAMTFTAGAILMMWFGELISEKGLGGGSSLLIFLGIIAAVPGLISQNIAYMDAVEKLILVGSYLFIIVAVVFVTESERRIKVQYSRRVRTGATYESFVPLKLTQFGVMPVIFAQALFTFPQIAANFIVSQQNVSEQVKSVAQSLVSFFSNQAYTEIGLFLLIIVFSFFYVTVVFNTDELAENLQKQGAFIPGIRPGKPTSNYLRKASFKLTAVGAVFLAALSVLPTLMTAAGIISTPLISGTGLLITVGAVLEIKRQIESMVVVRGYDKYL